MQIGGNPAIAAHTSKFMGIRNGIDLDIWDPENDSLLPMPYTCRNVVEVRLATFPAFASLHGTEGAPVILGGGAWHVNGL